MSNKNAYRFGVLRGDNLIIYAETRKFAQGFIAGLLQHYPCPECKLVEFSSFSPKKWEVVEIHPANGIPHVNRECVEEEKPSRNNLLKRLAGEDE